MPAPEIPFWGIIAAGIYLLAVSVWYFFHDGKAARSSDEEPP